LLVAGFPILMLADLKGDLISKWTEHLVSQGIPTASLQVFSLTDFAAPNYAINNIFVMKSEQWQQAIHALYQQSKFDMIEFHEYAGVAFNTIESKLFCKELKQSLCLPSSVKIVVRAHGSLELIDLAEGVSAAVNPERSAMHIMERSTMRLADAFILQSKSMMKLYNEAYDLNSAVIHQTIIHPPMNTILGGLSRVQINSGAKSVLIYGKLQKVKGSDTVVKAIVGFLSLHPYYEGDFVFTGLDMIIDGNSVKAELQKLIPDRHRNKISFESPIPRNELPSYILKRNFKVAVFGSTFETFSMATHELCRVGLPLIISNISAYQDFFNTENAILFEPSNVDSLIDALERVLLGDTVKFCPQLQYTNTAVEYQILYDTLIGVRLTKEQEQKKLKEFLLDREAKQRVAQ
jgi:glycosyltransferase involved in cell wall biosynthesis